MIQCIPRRYVIVILGFFSFAILNSQRVNVAIAIVAMTGSSVQMTSTHTRSECPRDTQINATNTYIKQRTFEWDSKTQGFIISSSFVGFVLTQIPGGRFSETLGAKEVLSFSILFASVCNILSPLAAVWNVYFFAIIQLAKGMAQGLTQPAVSCLMARWYPKKERSFLSSITYSGFPVGALVGGILSGTLCDTSMFGGWPAVFYVFGFAGVILAFIEVLLIYNSPEDYDASKNSQSETIISEEKPSNKEKLEIPWFRMMFSVPTLALLAGMIGQYWMTFYFISVHPTYLSDVLNLDITQNGLFSSLPYILQIIITWVGSSLSDWSVQNKYASTDTARKYCNTLSCLGFSLSMLGVVFAECSIILNIICFFIAMASIGLGFPGSLTVPMDMTKHFVGTLVGLCGTIASSSGFIIPVIVGYITQSEGSLSQWCKVIYISISVVMLSGSIFFIFGSAELQEWGVSVDELNKSTEITDQEKAVNSIK